MDSKQSGFDLDLGDPNSEVPDKGYALRGKIMLIVTLALAFVLILMVCVHLYVRWYLIPARHRRIRRSTRLFLYASRAALPSAGLDPKVLTSLPVFVYSSETYPNSIDCAVCLSDFEEKEVGRLLPKCNHSFHIECIDMWFRSHSTCPLCRSPVEPVSGKSIQMIPSNTGSSSSVRDTCPQREDHMCASTSSFEGQTKPVGLNVINVENESGTESSANQEFRSPMSRMLSFTRILGIDRRQSMPPSPTHVDGCGSGDLASEADLERGREMSQHDQA